jgi:menaquinone-specific isochorismate synthase
VRLDVAWRSIDEDRPLLDLLPAVPDDERFVFVRGDEGVVAWGVAHRIPVGRGSGRFARAQDGLSALAQDDGNDPLAFGSFTFDEEDDGSVLVIPRVAIQRRNGATRRMTAGPVADDDGDPAIEEIEEDRPRYAGSTVRDADWLDAVATAIERIEAGEITKVVLARDVNLWSKRPFNTGRVLRDLAARFPSCMTFLVDHLLGASPELLLERTGTTIRSRVLAGSAPRGTDDDADLALGAALLASAKDRHEHAIALTSAIDALAPYCAKLEHPGGPSLTRLDNIQHLGSDITGVLTDTAAWPAAHVLELLGTLHPTAAVGGEPRGRAVEFIRDHEGMPRDRYTGPVGWCTAHGNGEFAIALRCAEIRENRARLFAGAGIVTGSLPEDELAETWLKLQAMTKVLDA